MWSEMTGLRVLLAVIFALVLLFYAADKQQRRRLVWSQIHNHIYPELSNTS